MDEIQDLTPEEEAILYDDPPTVGGPFGKGALLRERLGLFRRRAVAKMVEEGVERAKAIEAVGEFGDGKILDWIITHGPEIIAFVKMIMALFML
jgi:hypothetical protein